MSFKSLRLAKALEFPVIRLAVFGHVHSALFGGTFLLAIIQKCCVRILSLVVHEINALARSSATFSAFSLGVTPIAIFL